MKDLETLKGTLEKERKVLISDLKGVSVHRGSKDSDEWDAVPEGSNGGVDKADSTEVAEKIESYEENLALVSELEARLRNIDAALKRIEDGSYGLCEVCGLPIEDDRLKANPAARTCKQHIETHLNK